MRRTYRSFQCIVVLVLVVSALAPAWSLAAAKGEKPGYQTGFHLWRGVDGDFAGWELNGVALAEMNLPDGQSLGPVLTLGPNSGLVYETDPAGAYYGGNFYNGADYYVGEATSPVLETAFAFKEAIASWNANTVPGTWVETQVRARLGDRWTKWYNLGVWSAGYETIERHSVRLQGDTDGYVAVDTLVLGKSKVPASSLQVKLRLFRAADSTASPSVSSLGLTYSSETPKKAVPSTGDPAMWNTLLSVPECSQMVYPDGGEVWCSPTSTSMVLGYWQNDTGPCEPRVRAAVNGVYDWIYDGHGNWPFNTAYAASQGMEGYVARYADLSRLEPWVKAGVPVVMSIAWGKGELTNAAIPSSNGHLVVLVGFDAQGNAIVNDPAASSDADVQRVYLRNELESVWLTNSGGTVYLIFPPGHAIPSF